MRPERKNKSSERRARKGKALPLLENAAFRKSVYVPMLTVDSSEMEVNH